MQTRTREYWFDPDTGLTVGRRCGCKAPKHAEWIDYPNPGSMPLELFSFEVPLGATLRAEEQERRGIEHL